MNHGQAIGFLKAPGLLGLVTTNMRNKAMPETSKPKFSVKIYLRLLAYAKEYPWRIRLLGLSMLLSALSTSFVMYQLKPILDGTFVITDNPTEKFNHLIYFVLPLTFGAAAIRALSGYGQQYYIGYLSQQIIQKLRNNLYAHFLTLPMAYFNSQRTGGLATRITSDVQKLQDSITNVVGGGVTSTLTGLSLVLVIIYLDWKMALIALVVFPLALFPIYRYGKKIRRASGEQQQHLADLNSQVHETLSGIRVVKAFGMEPYERNKFQKTNEKFRQTTMRSIRAFAASSPIVEAIATVALMVLMVWLANRALFPPHDLTVGQFGAFFGATASLYPQLKNFNGLWSGLQNAVASAERCFEILDTPDPMRDEKDAVEVVALRKSLEFKNVNFEYVPGHPVLKNISFSVERGEVVALVGPSGGGKTTLVDLIPRFYHPTSGEILWDGQNIAKIKVDSLRSHIGIVTQETILFHDSITRNIAYGRPTADFWDVQKAAQAAYANDFIVNSPQGYNTVIGERGVKLSGGQRQRLAIARAILKNPPFLILDEATSALDTESEQLVQKALDELMGHRTTLVIAHRLSTVRKADRIMVIDKGRIVEEGKHTTLLNKNGLYAKLYRMQFRDMAHEDNEPAGSI